jgi:uncharacterized protein YdaU (DUF1376 family)
MAQNMEPTGSRITQMKVPPAFQFYWSDFLLGTQEMTAEELGGYMRLLCHQWHSFGVPDDDVKIAEIARCRGNAVAVLRQKFGMVKEGRLFNIRLEKVRQEQDAYREKQAEKARKKWQKHAAAFPLHSSGIPKSTEKGMPHGCPPSSSKEEEAATARKKRVSRRTEVTDEWIAQLETMECYRGIDVRREAGRAKVWAESNRRDYNQRFFTNWLNRVDPSERTFVRPTAAGKSYVMTEEEKAHFDKRQAEIKAKQSEGWKELFE